MAGCWQSLAGWEVFWKDRLEAIEREARDVVLVEIEKNLHELLPQAVAIFADHLQCYSESRRQAPIYYSLSRESGSYTLRIYYSTQLPGRNFPGTNRS
jgi:hypothetical protein